MAAINLQTMDVPQFKIPRCDLPQVLFSSPVREQPNWTDRQKLSHFMQDIGITGISGVEGSGKSLLMTRIATECHKLDGRVLSFPGYKLYDKKGKEISEEITVEKWATMPDDLKDVLICIDEIEDFFNAHSWQSIMVRLFTGVFGQRRKRNMGIVYTLQFFEELPKLMRRKTHFIIECVDAARYNDVRITKGEKPISPGTVTYTRIIDNFGKKNLFIPGYSYQGPIYHNEQMFNLYDTYKNVDIFEQFTKIEINRKVVKIDMNGDGLTTEAEAKESQRLYDDAKVALINAFEKKNNRLQGSEYWIAAHLNPQNSAHQKIAAQLNEDLGIDKQYRTYIRDYAAIPLQHTHGANNA